MRVYFDWNATTPPHPDVLRGLTDWARVGGNPSSPHGEGRAARRLVEDARLALAALTALSPDQIQFTASGTEANVTALTGHPNRRALVCAADHPSSRRARADALLYPVDGNGLVDLTALAALLAEPDAAPAIVSLHYANNETGVIQPVAAVAALTRAAGAFLHLDAAQAPGRIPLAPALAAADLVTLSAHKMRGLIGAAALLTVNEAAAPAPLLRGGGQERDRRAGTEAVVPIAAFGCAAQRLDESLDAADHMAALRDRLESALADDAVFFGADAPRLPNTSCFAMPGISAASQVMALDLAGFAVSAGAACAAGRLRPSPVLAAMGVAPERVACALRVSLGPDNSAAEIDRFVAAWKAVLRRAQV